MAKWKKAGGWAWLLVKMTGWRLVILVGERSSKAV